MAAGVAHLVERRAVPINRLEIGLRRRHLNIVVQDIEIGASAADAEVDAGRPDERLSFRLDQAGRRRWHDGLDLLGEIFALSRVEDNEALEERYRADFLTGFAGATFLVLG